MKRCQLCWKVLTSGDSPEGICFKCKLEEGPMTTKPKDKYREMLFSETNENFTVDDYITNGDDGPWYNVVSSQAFQNLKADFDKLKECVEQIYDKSSAWEGFDDIYAMEKSKEALSQVKDWDLLLKYI